MNDHRCGWSRASRAYAAGNNVTGKRPTSRYASTTSGDTSPVATSASARARAADRCPPPTRECTIRTRRASPSIGASPVGRARQYLEALFCPLKIRILLERASKFLLGFGKLLGVDINPPERVAIRRVAGRVFLQVDGFLEVGLRLVVVLLHVEDPAELAPPVGVHRIDLE